VIKTLLSDTHSLIWYVPKPYLIHPIEEGSFPIKGLWKNPILKLFWIDFGKDYTIYLIIYNEDDYYYRIPLIKSIHNVILIFPLYF